MNGVDGPHRASVQHAQGEGKGAQRGWTGGRGRHPGVGVTQTPALVLMVPTWCRSLYPVNLNFGVETCIDSSFTLVVRIFCKGEIIYFISECPIPLNAFT